MERPSQLTSSRLREKSEQLSIVFDGGRFLVEAFVNRRLIQTGENGAQSEVTLGVAAAARHRVIVIKKPGDLPSESFQDMFERLAYQSVRAHHSGQRWIVFALVTKRVRLSTHG